MGTTRGSRISYLDSLRGLAVLSVVSVHCLQVANSKNLLPQQSAILEIGQYGVELFFMISGWLIYMLYGNTKNFTMKVFVRRRLARIYPLWVLFVFIGSIMNLAKLTPFFGTITRTDRFSDIALMPLSLLLGLSFTLWTFAPFWNSVVPGGWSIQCEVYNYLLFALFRSFSLRRIITYTTGFNILFFLMLQIDSIRKIPTSFAVLKALNRLNLLNSFSYFLLGALICRLFTFYSDSKRQKFHFLAGFNDIALVSTFLLSILFTPIAFGKQMHCIFYVGASLLLCGIAQRYRYPAAVLAILGKYSYSIYFTHFYFLSLMAFINPGFLFSPNTNLYLSWVILTLLTLAVTYVAGTVSWKYFESPLRNYFR